MCGVRESANEWMDEGVCRERGDRGIMDILILNKTGIHRNNANENLKRSAKFSSIIIPFYTAIIITGKADEKQHHCFQKISIFPFMGLRDIHGKKL